MKLTPYQKRILLVLCDAAERDEPYGGRRHGALLRTYTGVKALRETTSGAALVRKGLATRCLHGGATFYVTDAGYHLGDALRIEDRLGKVPPRGQAG